MTRIKKYVFDSYAMFAYLEGEQGAKTVAEILKEALNDKAEILMSVINWGEIYYIVLRELGEKTAKLYLQTIERYPIKIIAAENEITLKAAKIKAFNKLSYADAFAAALSMENKAKLVTGDKEFKSLEGKTKIIWI
jgi:predicted nucleic acid-binding protein